METLPFHSGAIAFITDNNGNLVKKAGSSEGVLYHKFMIRRQITAKRLWNFID